jgi:hypothetical protein
MFAYPIELIDDDLRHVPCHLSGLPEVTSFAWMRRRALRAMTP